MTPPTYYPEVGSTSSLLHAYIRECVAICETVETVYNPYRGRDACVAGSGGGTRYARLPPVIEIIPRRGIACTTFEGLMALSLDEEAIET